MVAMMGPGGPPLVLASGSPTRRAMLEAVRVPVMAVQAPDVDEQVLRRTLTKAGATAEDAAVALARAKAEAVTGGYPEALVLGADQILETEAGVWLEKPGTLDEAADQLRCLRGRTHRLISGAVLVRDGVGVWQGVDTAVLTMRSLSDETIAAYLEAAGEAVTGSVGGYQVEGVGAHLFSGVRGDMFTILGLPMLSVLDALRFYGVVRS